MSINDQVKGLVRLEKQLRGIRIMVSTTKDGIVKVKWGKKFDMIEVPDRQWGNMIKEEIELVISKKADAVAMAISHVKARVEQLSLELFGKGEENGNEGSVRQSREQVQDIAGQGDSGEKRETDVCTGDDCGTGEPSDASGAEGGRQRLSS
jgi:hypothetical protein